MPSMCDELYDVIVVGGGPAGLFASRYASMGGARTLLVERNPSFSGPVICGEFIPSFEEARSLMPNARGLSDFYEIASKTVSNRTSSILMFSPSNRLYEFKFHGLVLNKGLLNDTLASGSKRVGVEAVASCLVRKIDRKGDHLKIHAITRNGPKTLEAKVVVGADGFPSTTASSAGMESGFYESDLALCISRQMIDVRTDEKAVEMYFGNMIAPGGYAWIIPKEDGAANVGLGVRLPRLEHGKNLHWWFNIFQTKHPVASPKLLNAKTIRSSIKFIPVGGVAKQICRGRILLAGDSAGTVVPINGGGILTAAISGRIAGEQAASFVRGESSLSGYRRLVNDEIGDLIQRGLAYRKAADKVMGHDTLFNIMFSLLRGDNIAKIVQCRDSIFSKLLRFI
ncbi:NAD(P)/FAD-dependent oxidoreductase [Candidatus Bathyarchaeota archaeon]|nr:NAD(P)/FAD-dependent oxidoreductase [Candidatus Bathyarchaeota archaeon]MBS7629620.1 NAD(P)/FAD-dependent oxidoreductase [Candidatus Bathyarchaeota archaeon]